jgi:formiminotetrahydrofolate cyclodeaminase
MTNHQAPEDLTDLSVNDFLRVVSAASPTPGGGSAAALAGATAAALVSMVAGIGLARSGNPAARSELGEIVSRATVLQHRLASLINEDAEAYAQVLAAYRLPKETEQQKVDRTLAIQAGLKLAAQTPLDSAVACAEVLRLAGDSASLGIASTASDAAVAALLAHAGLRGAALNVAVNLDNIRDQEFVAHADAALEEVLQTAEPLLAAALAPVGREG